MRIFLDQNVFDAALDRIRYLFNEFENIMVCISGGKDSTVIYNLCKIVAKEQNKLPMKVLFLDQEAEWESVIDHVREIMNDPDVEPYWIQAPILLKNATSIGEPFLRCWEEGADWMRPKESNSIHENNYGTERFHPLWANILRYYFPKQKACYIVGMRAEELQKTFYDLKDNKSPKKEFPVELRFFPLFLDFVIQLITILYLPFKFADFFL